MTRSSSRASVPMAGQGGIETNPRPGDHPRGDRRPGPRRPGGVESLGPQLRGGLVSKVLPALECGSFPASLSRSPVSRFGFNDRQFCGRLTCGQSPDYPGGVPIGGFTLFQRHHPSWYPSAYALAILDGEYTFGAFDGLDDRLAANAVLTVPGADMENQGPMPGTMPSALSFLHGH
jgi:hypothetical protein